MDSFAKMAEEFLFSIKNLMISELQNLNEEVVSPTMLLFWFRITQIFTHHTAFSNVNNINYFFSFVKAE